MWLIWFYKMSTYSIIIIIFFFRTQVSGSNARSKNKIPFFNNRSTVDRKIILKRWMTQISVGHFFLLHFFGSVWQEWSLWEIRSTSCLIEKRSSNFFLSLFCSPGWEESSVQQWKTRHAEEARSPLPSFNLFFLFLLLSCGLPAHPRGTGAGRAKSRVVEPNVAITSSRLQRLHKVAAIKIVVKVRCYSHAGVESNDLFLRLSIYANRVWTLLKMLYVYCEWLTRWRGARRKRRARMGGGGGGYELRESILYEARCSLSLRA